MGYLMSECYDHGEGERYLLLFQGCSRFGVRDENRE